jgi:hypothetical protein
MGRFRASPTSFRRIVRATLGRGPLQEPIGVAKILHVGRAQGGLHGLAAEVVVIFGEEGLGRSRGSSRPFEDTVRDEVVGQLVDEDFAPTRVEDRG